MNYIEEHYNNYDEESRLLSRHGSVEYLTTMHYIHEYMKPGDRVLEVGCATGRYSIALAKEGHCVTAVDLVQHNLDVLVSKLDGTEPIQVMRGNALDLGFMAPNQFDVTLVLGPLYHLYTKEDMHKALMEALRVTKHGGYVMVAYCMNDSCVLQHGFFTPDGSGLLNLDKADGNWKLKMAPEEVFTLMRVEEIDELNAKLPAFRVRFLATDGPTIYFRDQVDAMDDKTFDLWMKYHLSTCERRDLIGATNHTLDILQKV